jgi:hypothetical protein
MAFFFGKKISRPAAIPQVPLHGSTVFAYDPSSIVASGSCALHSWNDRTGNGHHINTISPEFGAGPLQPTASVDSDFGMGISFGHVDEHRAAIDRDLGDLQFSDKRLYCIYKTTAASLATYKTVWGVHVGGATSPRTHQKLETDDLSVFNSGVGLDRTFGNNEYNDGVPHLFEVAIGAPGADIFEQFVDGISVFSTNMHTNELEDFKTAVLS